MKTVHADALPAARDPCSIAVIGDSLSDTRSGGGGYLKLVRERSPETRIDNFAVGGHMVNQMRRRFAVTALTQPKRSYTHLVVFGGVNDLYSDQTAGRTPEKITRDLEWMYRAAQGHGMLIVAFTVAPWGGFSRYYNPRRAAATARVNRWILEQPEAGLVDVVVDAYPLLSCGNPERLCPELAAPYRDGLHFGPAGHRVLGEAVYKAAFQGCR
jgi:lysophospholipase L1-like esterase